MRIKDKNFIGFMLAIVFGLGLFVWGGLMAVADDKGVNFTYEIDMNATDSGATTVQGNRTIKDIQLLVGTSKKCTMVFKHTGSGVTKACTIGSGVTLTDNFYLDIRPGAELVVNASSWIASPGHLIMAPNQRVIGTASTKTLYFTSDHLKYSSYNGGTTTVQMPSAKIDTLTLQSGVGVNNIDPDVTLAGNSDASLATQKATRGYVDNALPAYYKHNLKIGPPGESGVTGANSNYSVAVTADELTLTDASGNKLLESGVSVTIYITTAGSDGLDTGVEAASTLYYAWVAHSGTTTQVAGFLSLSATAPTLPAIFTYKRLVGWVYNNAAGNFLIVFRLNDKVKFFNPLTLYYDATLETWYKTYILPDPIAKIEWTELDLLITTTSTGSHALPVLSGTTNLATPLVSAGGYNANQSNQFGSGFSPVLLTLPRVGSKETIYVRGNHNSQLTGNNLQILGCIDPR